jgi:predicted DNA-binding transcriptional regulator
MSRYVKHVQSNEEKVAIKIGTLLSDFRLDLESVGFYLSRVNPFTVYRRITESVESSIDQLEGETIRHD